MTSRRSRRGFDHDAETLALPVARYEKCDEIVLRQAQRLAQALTGCRMRMKHRLVYSVRNNAYQTAHSREMLCNLIGHTFGHGCQMPDAAWAVAETLGQAAEAQRDPPVQLIPEFWPSMRQDIDLGPSAEMTPVHSRYVDSVEDDRACRMQHPTAMAPHK